MEKNVPADFGAGVSESAIYPSACVDHPALVTGNVVPGQFDYRISKALKMDVIIPYDKVIFVDAHVYDNVDSLYCAPVSPDF